MEVFTRPIWKDQKAHEEADTAADSDRVEAVMCYFQYIFYTVARNCYQIKCQEKYYDPVVIVLFDVWEEPHVCCRSSC